MEPITKHDGSRHTPGAALQGSTIERAGKELHGAIEGVTQAAQPALDRLSEEAHAVVDRLAEAATDAQAVVVGRGEQLGRAGRRASHSARSMISDHPLSAVGIAVAAGFLLSRFVRTR